MFSVGQVLSAYYVHSKPYGSSSGSLKVYVPSVMPKISMGNPKVTPVGLNSSCYCNASDCKPSVASQISTQNYMTGLSPVNPYSLPCYYYGSGIKVVAKTTDCLTARLDSGEEDNSRSWPR